MSLNWLCQKWGQVQTLTVVLRDETYAALGRQARASGASPAHVAAASLEQQFKGTVSPRADAEKQAARERFERHFGEVDLGHATGSDNETIDADLAREYASNHRNT